MWNVNQRQRLPASVNPEIDKLIQLGYPYISGFQFQQCSFLVAAFQGFLNHLTYPYGDQTTRQFQLDLLDGIKGYLNKFGERSELMAKWHQYYTALEFIQKLVDFIYQQMFTEHSLGETAETLMFVDYWPYIEKLVRICLMMKLGYKYQTGILDETKFRVENLDELQQHMNYLQELSEIFGTKFVVFNAATTSTEPLIIKSPNLTQRWFFCPILYTAPIFSYCIHQRIKDFAAEDLRNFPSLDVEAEIPFFVTPENDCFE